MKNFFKRVTSLVSGLVILAQLFCAVPAMAAGDYICFFEYNDSSTLEYPNVKQPKGSYTIDNSDGNGVELDKTVEESGGVWPEDPTRIIGKRFIGWFVKDTDIQVTRQTKLTADMLTSGPLTIHLEGRWAEDDCADIKDPVIRSYDYLGNTLSSGLEFYNAQGVPVEFSSDNTEYYIKVLNNAVYAEFDFLVHEPAATYTISYNGEAAEKTEMITTIYSEAENMEFDSGISVNMSRVTLAQRSDEQEYNDIVVDVTAANGIDVKTYIFHIEKSAEQIKLAYGNTPFGRIAKDYSSTSFDEEYRQQKRDEFSSTYTFYGSTVFVQNKYDPKAWGEGQEVMGGIEPTVGQYRNYDKDETAVVAYIGSSFTDPGFTVYGADGNVISLSDSNTIKRTINYDTVNSYDFSEFDTFTSKTNEATLTGAAGENIISILKNEKVRPGVYTIRYEYASDVFAERKLIVIPRPGDMNMDGYINSIDVSMYNRNDRPDDSTQGGRLYLYRGMDLTQDGIIDQSDAEMLGNRTASYVQVVYPDLSAAETVTQGTYTPDESADNSKAHMYMDYLGKNSDEITVSADALPSSAQASEQLALGDVFWLGYRLDNTEAIQALGQGVYSLTVAINYDSRYVSPVAVLTDEESAAVSGEGEQWLATLKKYNGIWENYTYNRFTASEMEYSANNSAAATTLDSAAQIKTLVMDITTTGALNTPESGDYILRVPFEVNVVPPEGVKVTEASLDANTFNMTTGDGGETTFAWDTKGVLSNNLKNIIDFRGSFSPEFVEEEPAESINDCWGMEIIYGETIPSKNLNSLVTKGTLVGSLPDGLTYIKNTNTFRGVPAETGTFVFYISNKKLSLTISKAPMKVTAVDKTKMYGDANPELTYVYDESYIKTDVDTNGLESEGFTAGLTAPQLACAADTATEFGEQIPIYISGGESDNYYFEYENGTLTVDTQRPITVTAVANIPVCTSEMAYVNRNSFPFAIASSAQTDDSTLTADGIIGGDVVKVKYDVEYQNNTVADNVTVSIENMTIDETYGRSKNYTIAENRMTTSNQGRVLDKVLTGITVRQQPPRQYTYGQKYSYDKGITNIVLSFDNSQQISGLCVGDMAEYGIAVKAFDKDGTEMNETISEDLKLTVSDHNGMVVTLVPPEPEATLHGISNVNLVAVEILKKELRVQADNKQRVYGEENPELTFTYNSDDFAYDENATSMAFLSAGLTEPVASVLATQVSEVGTYPIFLRGGSHDNYKFVCTNGSLEIGKRTLNITSIDSGIPALTAKIIATDPDATEYVIEGTATSSQLTCTNVYNNDDFKITYKAVYKSKEANSSYTVEIRDVAIDETYGKGKNYSLGSKPTQAAGGVIHEKNVESFRIVTQPKLEYTYGDSLDLDTGLVEIVYDSGEIVTATFAQLADNNIQLQYAFVNGEIEDEQVVNGVKVNVPDYHDNYMTLIATSIYNLPRQYTNAFVVHKAEMNIRVVGTTSVYGDRPEFKYEYNSGDFKNGENQASDGFTRDLVPPSVDCEATRASDIGEYDVNLSDAEAANYVFNYTAGKHVINKRQIAVTEITGGVPPLTADIIFEQPGEQHDLPAWADMSKMNVTNAVAGDDIKIIYTARYNSTTPAESISVSVINPSLEEGYGKNKNYELTSVVATAEGGRISDREIELVEITEQPKIEYTYGDTLDLSGGKVRITYDSGLVEEDLTFAELSEHRITLTYTGTEDTPVHGEVLTVPYHNGKTITLTPATVHEVTAPETEPIEVEKKVIKVTADSTTSVYGNSAEFTFGYDISDFVNGESPEAEAFTDGLTSPVASCVVDETTEVGEYTVTVSGGEATNYKFEYYTGTHEVTPRPLTVTEITGGVPPLTSDIIFAQEGEVHDLPAWADLERMEVSNAIDGDDIKIIYKARYNSVTPVESIDIEVVDAELEEGYGKNRNYTLASVVSTAGGGRIYDREIELVEITEQPKIEYTYGDTLDLSGGKVRITYDSGLVEEDLTFAELSEHRITLTYTGTEDTPVHGEVLTVPYHNGKTITLTPATVHEVTAPATEPITVNKKMLTYGTCVVDSIIYDGSTTLTTGTVVLEGEENGDTLVATGVFNFENYLAGENKTVYITEIELDEQTTLNYQIAEDNTTAQGTIEKATPTAQLSEEDVELSVDNIITITAPEMTQMQQDGGAEYEYTIDGGQTWQKSNVFEELALRLDCAVSIRFAETDNFKQSEATQPIEIKTYLNKITLISYDDMNTLASFFTNVEGAENDGDLEELIGDVGVTYYIFYYDEGDTEVDFPLTFTGDMTFYTSLKKPEDPNSKGNLVYVLPGTKNTENQQEEELANLPYINGCAGMIYPDKYMTRAEAATVMVRIMGDTGLEYENSFPDVSGDAWYAGYIAQASARGLVTGFDDGLFRPEEFVTREQFAVMVARMIELAPIEGESFVDVKPDRWSAGYIKAVSEKGIVSGYEDKTFRPEKPITRAEAVRMLNVATGRIPDTQLIDQLDCLFMDIPKTHWAYYEIMTAACEF